MTRTPAPTSTSGTIAFTNGTRLSPAVGTAQDHEQVLAVVQHVGDHADRLAGGGAHRQADQLVVAELVRVGM